jgi:homoserine O-acetyltransferase
VLQFEVERVRSLFEPARSAVEALLRLGPGTPGSSAPGAEPPAPLGPGDAARVDSLIGIATQGGTLDAPLGAIEAMIGAGDLELLGDPMLVGDLTALPALMADLDREQTNASNKIEEIYGYLGEAGVDASGIGLDPFDTPWEVRASESWRVVTAPRARGLLTDLWFYADNTATSLRTVAETIGRIEAALGRADLPELNRRVLLNPRYPAWSDAAPDTFHAVFETSKGDFTLEVIREWAPIGVDRFWNLARFGYYDDTRFHRVVPDFITQFGVSGDPVLNEIWYARGMPDDPVVGTNTRGTVAYAFTEPGTRSTQLYINMVDNTRLDADGFAPIGRVIEGMESVVDRIWSGYGEDSGGGVRRGNQAPLVEGGNAYADRTWPELDRIVRVRIEER